jgi:LysM repeat protein
MQVGIGSRIHCHGGIAALVLIALAMLLTPARAHAAPALAAPVQDGTVIYTVKPGDRLGDIAARYGTTASAIVRANNLASADVIYPGQRLTIPAGGSSTGGASGATSAPAPATSAKKYHTVQPGETLAKIAQTYGVSASAISAANGLSNVDLIRVGQQLLIPGGSGSSGSGSANPPDPKPRPQTTYLVQPGDTLGAIAKRYATSVQALVEANGLNSPDRISVGMRLVIPKDGGSLPSYPGQATRFVASISAQRCWLYQGDTVIAKWACSTGRSGWGTRPGTYKIQSKIQKAYGSRWNIWMPYWLGIYWAGGSENGIHGLPWNASSGKEVWSGLVGTPITYGCVMLDNTHAKLLYDMAYIGMPVVIRP